MEVVSELVGRGGGIIDGLRSLDIARGLEGGVRGGVETVCQFIRSVCHERNKLLIHRGHCNLVFSDL